MKKFSKIALLLLLVLASVFVMAACEKDGDDGVVINGTIAVKADAMPQLQYVQGEELDFSNGMLEVKNGDVTTEVALNAEGVTVTGYDKNVLGDQTVTITYQGCTTQLTVTVVARMVTEDVVTDYLVGDSFDISHGRLKITRNDGSSFTAIFNSDKVTISGFDGSKAGQQTLTATYKNGDTTYSCQFLVTVHAVDSVTFNKPTKLKYNSHDTALNLNGGSLVLKGYNNTLVRELNLDAEGVAVSGFDPSAVNEQNTPLSQTITVTYNSTPYTFDISLTYTDISSFKESAVDFLALDWTDPNLSFSKAMGETALELIQLYMDFSPAEQAYITDEERLSVARAAFMYGLSSVQEEQKNLSGAFVIKNGSLYLVCENRSDVQAAIVRLSKDNNVLYTATPVLIDMAKAFAGDILLESTTGTMYFKDAFIIPVEYYEVLLGVFEHMIDVADVSAEIPADWATQGIANYSGKIENLYALIKGNEAEMAAWNEIYYRISAWRANDDMFDILYQHYYAQKNTDALNTLAGIRFPTGLEDIVVYISGMMEQQEYFNKHYVYDGIWVLYYYQLAVDAADVVKNGNDDILKGLYDVLPINALLGFSTEDTAYLFTIDEMLEYLRTAENGYYSFCGGLLGDPDFHAFLNDYVDVITKILEDDENKTYQTSTQYGDDMKALLNAYVALTPTQQLNLMTVFNAFYGSGDPYPQFAFDAVIEVEGQKIDLSCLLVDLLNGYYETQFTTDAGKAAYKDLMIAMEIYAQRGADAENWYTNFTARLNSIESAYKNGMSEADKAKFDTLLDAIYDQYVGYLAVYDAGAAITTPEQLQNALGEWEDEFLALQDAVSVMWGAYIYHMGYDTPMHTMFFMGYERAMTIYNKIVTEAPDEIVAILYHYDIYGKIGLTEGFSEATGNSFEYFMGICRTVYISYLQTAMGGSIYDLYMEGGLKSFMDKAYDILDEDLDEATMITIMNAFRNLSVEDQMMFISLDGDSAPYVNAIINYVLAIDSESPDPENPIFIHYTKKAAEVIDILLYVEQYTVLYRYYETMEGVPAEYLAMIAEYIGNFVYGKEATEEGEEDFVGLVALYKALAENEEDKESFQAFEEMYEYYLDICEDILGTTAA